MPTGEEVIRKISQEKNLEAYKWLTVPRSEIEANVMDNYGLLNRDPKSNIKLKPGAYQTTFDTFERS